MEPRKLRIVKNTAYPAMRFSTGSISWTTTDPANLSRSSSPSLLTSAKHIEILLVEGVRICVPQGARPDELRMVLQVLREQ